jgi:HK97 family phage prohead protease
MTDPVQDQQQQQGNLLPRDGLFRAVRRGCEFRQQGKDDTPTLVGHFAVFNEWAEINSIFEGNFLERIAPGAFKKTFREQRDEMRVLFQHGHDPQLGDKPLGPIDELKEDDTGAWYEVPLLDTSYNRDLLPGLEAELYGASFRFRVMREEFEEEPGRSDHNPDGLPERTIKEAQVFEFGPVTFPAYAQATAGVRSLTRQFLDTPERLAEYIERNPEFFQANQDRLGAMLALLVGGVRRKEESETLVPSEDETVNGTSRQEAEEDTETTPAQRRATSAKGVWLINTQRKEPKWL